MISEFLAYFHCACAQTAISELLGPDLQRIVSATYDKWNLRQLQVGVFRTSYIIAEDQNKVFDAKFHIGSVSLPSLGAGTTIDVKNYVISFNKYSRRNKLLFVLFESNGRLAD